MNLCFLQPKHMFLIHHNLEANINLVGTGKYPKLDKRFAGSFGSALMYYVIPKVILFRQEHSPRTLVKKVDFISAPGISKDNLYRPGGPKYLLTNKALFSFNKNNKMFCLERTAQGISQCEVKKLTGFDYEVNTSINNFVLPSKSRLETLRKKIAPMVSEFYPHFTKKLWPS